MQSSTRAKITLTGRSPGLVLNSIELADDTNPYVIKIRELVDAGRGSNTLTDEQRDRKERLQWRGSLGTLYTDGQQIIVPANNLFKATVEAAKDYRLGAKIEDRGAIIFEQPTLAIGHDGPDDLDKMYADERYRLRNVVNGNPSKGNKGGKVVIMRPVFPVWETTVTVMLLPELINWESFCKVIESAGNVGIGNARKIGYGRFDVQINKLT
jgi:hypothetical protein